MPRDEWAREKRRIDSHRRVAKFYRRPKRIKTPNPRTIPAGTFVRIRKIAEITTHPFTEYRTRVPVRFTKFVAATKKSLLIEHQGYQIWVSKSRLIINR